MSSILDALNKLEREKAAAQTIDLEVDPALAARELLGQDILRDKVAVQVRPANLILTIMVFALVLVGLSVWISTRMVARQAPVAPAASLAPERVVAERAVALPHEPESGAEGEAAVLEFTNVGVVAPIPELAKAPVDANPIADTPVPDAEVAPSVPQTLDIAEAPVIKFTNVAVVVPIREEVARAELVEPEEVFSKGAMETVSDANADEALVLLKDVHKLPLLTSAIREQYNLGDVKLNMVWPADLSRPYGRPYDLALMNRMKVQVGDRIPSTTVRLIKVERDGVAIEIIGTRKYFFIPL